MEEDCGRAAADRHHLEESLALPIFGRLRTPGYTHTEARLNVGTIAIVNIRNLWISRWPHAKGNRSQTSWLDWIRSFWLQNLIQFMERLVSAPGLAPSLKTCNRGVLEAISRHDTPVRSWVRLPSCRDRYLPPKAVLRGRNSGDLSPGRSPGVRFRQGPGMPPSTLASGHPR